MTNLADSPDRQWSKPVATLLVVVFLSATLVGLGGIVMAFAGLLSPTLGAFGAALGAFIALVVGVLAAFGKHIRQAIMRANRPVAVVGPLLVATVILVSLGFVSKGPHTPVCCSSTLKTILQQSAPDCQNPPGVVWDIPGPDTTATECTESGLQVQQTSHTNFAELDLDQVQSASYNQTEFAVQVDVTFPVPRDTLTHAGMIVQTPKAADQNGGYIFIVNSQGQWELQRVDTSTSLTPVASGNLNLHGSATITLRIYMHAKQLIPSIKGAPLPSVADELDQSPSVVGLMVENAAGSSSPVVFSDFVLSTPSA